MNNDAEAEKIRHFCYELALILRRITSKVNEDGTGEEAVAIEDPKTNPNGELEVRQTDSLDGKP
jgi:hypothetical protein